MDVEREGTEGMSQTSGRNDEGSGKETRHGRGGRRGCVEAEHPEEELGRVRAGERTFEGLGYKRLADNWPNEHFIDEHSAKRSLH